MKVIVSSMFDEILRAWSILEKRWEAYRLVVPGDASFVCQPESCDAHCCRKFSVSLGDTEVQRMHQSSGLMPEQFLEVEDGRPVRLPLAQPYLLARAANRCAMLADDLRCTQYHGRPNACRLYPHFVVAFDLEAGRAERSGYPGLAALVDDALNGRPTGQMAPLLLRHVECPGFTGGPLTEDAWVALFRATAAMQTMVDAPDAAP